MLELERGRIAELSRSSWTRTGSSRSSVCPRGSTPRGAPRAGPGQAHEGDDPAQLRRRSVQTDLGAAPARRELKARKGVYRHSVCGDTGNATEHDIDLPHRQERAYPGIEARQIRARERSLDLEGQRSGRRTGHRSKRDSGGMEEVSFGEQTRRSVIALETEPMTDTHRHMAAALRAGVRGREG